MASSYSNISNVYDSKGEYDQALELFPFCLRYQRIISGKKKLWEIIYNIGRQSTFYPH